MFLAGARVGQQCYDGGRVTGHQYCRAHGGELLGLRRVAQAILVCWYSLRLLP